jgi:hypothetical protein
VANEFAAAEKSWQESVHGRPATIAAVQKPGGRTTPPGHPETTSQTRISSLSTSEFAKFPQIDSNRGSRLFSDLTENTVALER